MFSVRLFTLSQGLEDWKFSFVYLSIFHLLLHLVSILQFETKYCICFSYYQRIFCKIYMIPKRLFFPTNTLNEEIGIFLTVLVAMHTSEHFHLLPLIAVE